MSSKCGLTDKQIYDIGRHCVEKAKLTHTDEQLWAWLLELYEEKIEILSTISSYYYFAHKSEHDRSFWQYHWTKRCNQVNDNRLMDCIIWHLSKRGDPRIGPWIIECEKYERENTTKWVNCGEEVMNG